MNTFGRIYSFTTFGESHGPAIGGVIDGMPSGLKINLDRVQAELDRRRPGQSALTTARDEKDRVEILSGLFEGITTGTSIGFIVRNADQHSRDYEEMRTIYRPSHADYTYDMKYGLRDHRGGGRSSARENISRVVAGAFARQALETMGVSVYAYTSQVGDIALDKDYTQYDPQLIETNPVRCPDPATAEHMAELIKQVKADGDTIGGVITCVAKGVPAGWGEPIYGKLNARLADAMLSINAVKGFEIGMGFDGVSHRGSEMNDAFVPGGKGITTLTNHSGGIQGGISNGEDIYFRVAFKPVATLLKEVVTVDRDGHGTLLQARGRHDPCVLPRAVPVVEAMTCATLLDAALLARTTRL
ncbi:MAG: chorismate synthase [Bacteroidales bacterium]|nr:chorismate synthase [Bacteroidales bacterium]MCD8393642.1 chorismate synthase [Bacteroidales bacterium]